MSQWIKAAKQQDIEENSAVVSECAGHSVAIFRLQDKFHAINNVCPHKGGPLGEGELNGSVVSCPWHAWDFDVITGCNPDNERLKVKTYPVKLEGDDVLVEI